MADGEVSTLCCGQQAAKGPEPGEGERLEASVMLREKQGQHQGSLHSSGLTDREESLLLKMGIHLGKD